MAKRLHQRVFTKQQDLNLPLHCHEQANSCAVVACDADNKVLQNTRRSELSVPRLTSEGQFAVVDIGVREIHRYNQVC